ncbi:MAG: alpha/beta fold hydrolase [Candidatus Methanoplasma sp.]|jgi:pimeloyl-ACP methyl ester carboxylesterase|nr:alpha/beta fold hydrolase [Candidatus Methanoplasma sp.]
MSKKIIAAVALTACLVAAAAAVMMLPSDKNDGIAASNEEAAVSLIYGLDRGEYVLLYKAMNSDMRSQYPVGNIKTAWKEKTNDLGDLLSIERMNVAEEKDGTGIDLYCAFEKGGKKIGLAFDAEGLVSGLSFEDYDQDIFDKLPAGLKENSVKLNAGSKWELNGNLTTRTGGPSDTVAVIVHGSGPNDMDGTIGPTKIYRDIAWGLPQCGIDVLRYDKRTYVHGAAIMEDYAKFTVMEETIDDAVAAAKLMESYGYKKIILIGHSMGGMLAPAIVRESKGLYDGFVSLAGSPRTLVEIIADQNLALATETNYVFIKFFVNSELAKLRQLDSWTEEELLSKTIFTIPAYYIKDMVSRDAGEIAASMDIPMLFLQGSADFQVYPEKDFEKWKEILSGKEGAEFKLYNGLNHLFMVSQGDKAGTTGEYTLKGHVGQHVIDDIAEFINGNF